MCGLLALSFRLHPLLPARLRVALFSSFGLAPRDHRAAVAKVRGLRRSSVSLSANFFVFSWLSICSAASSRAGFRSESVSPSLSFALFWHALHSRRMTPARETRRARGGTAGASSAEPSPESFFSPRSGVCAAAPSSPCISGKGEQGADPRARVDLAPRHASSAEASDRGANSSGSLEALAGAGLRFSRRPSSGDEDSASEGLGKRRSTSQSAASVSPSVSSCCPSASSHYCPSSASLSSSASQSAVSAEGFLRRVSWGSRSAGGPRAALAPLASGKGPLSLSEPSAPPACGCPPAALDFHQALTLHADKQLASPPSQSAGVSSCAAFASSARSLASAPLGETDSAGAAPHRSTPVGMRAELGGRDTRPRILSGHAARQAVAVREEGGNGGASAEERVRPHPEEKAERNAARASTWVEPCVDQEERKTPDVKGHLCATQREEPRQPPLVSAGGTGGDGKGGTDPAPSPRSAPSASSLDSAPRESAVLAASLNESFASAVDGARSSSGGRSGGAPLGKSRARLQLMRHGLAPVPGVSPHPTGGERTADSLRLLRDLQSLPGPHGLHARHLATFLQKHREIFAPATVSVRARAERDRDASTRRASGHAFVHVYGPGQGGEGGRERLFFSSSGHMRFAPSGALVDSATGEHSYGDLHPPFVQWVSALVSASSASSVFGVGPDPTASQGNPHRHAGRPPTANVGREERPFVRQADSLAEGRWPEEGEAGASAFSSPRSLHSPGEDGGDGGRTTVETAGGGDGEATVFAAFCLSPAARRFQASRGPLAFSGVATPGGADDGRDTAGLGPASGDEEALTRVRLCTLSPSWPLSPASLSAGNSPSTSIVSTADNLHSAALAASAAHEMTQETLESYGGNEQANSAGWPRDSCGASRGDLGGLRGGTERDLQAASAGFASPASPHFEAAQGEDAEGCGGGQEARDGDAKQRRRQEASGDAALLGASKARRGWRAEVAFGASHPPARQRCVSREAGESGETRRANVRGDRAGDGGAPAAALRVDGGLSSSLFSRCRTAPQPLRTLLQCEESVSPSAPLPPSECVPNLSRSLCLLAPSSAPRASRRITVAAPEAAGLPRVAAPSEPLQRRGKSLPPPRSREWRKSRAAVAAILGSTVASWRTSHLARHLGRFPFFAELRDVCHEVYIHSRFGRFYASAGAERATSPASRGDWERATSVGGRWAGWREAESGASANPRPRNFVHGHGPSVSRSSVAGDSPRQSAERWNGRRGRAAPGQASAVGPGSPRNHLPAGARSFPSAPSPVDACAASSDEGRELKPASSRRAPRSPAAASGFSPLGWQERRGGSQRSETGGRGEEWREARWTGAECRSRRPPRSPDGFSGEEQSSERSSSEGWGHGDIEQPLQRRGRATSHSPHRSVRHSDPRPFMSPSRRGYSLRRKLWRFTNVPADATLVTGPGNEAEKPGGRGELRQSPCRPDEGHRALWCPSPQRRPRRADARGHAGGRQVSPSVSPGAFACQGLGDHTARRRVPSTCEGRRRSTGTSGSPDAVSEWENYRRPASAKALSSAGSARRGGEPDGGQEDRQGMEAGRGAALCRKIRERLSGRGTSRQRGEGPRRVERDGGERTPVVRPARVEPTPRDSTCQTCWPKAGDAGSRASSSPLSSRSSFESPLASRGAAATSFAGSPRRSSPEALAQSSCSPPVLCSSTGTRRDSEKGTIPQSPASRTARSRAERAGESGGDCPAASSGTTSPRSHVIRSFAASERDSDHEETSVSAPRSLLSHARPGLGHRCVSGPPGEGLFFQSARPSTPQILSTVSLATGEYEGDERQSTTNRGGTGAVACAGQAKQAQRPRGSGEGEERRLGERRRNRGGTAAQGKERSAETRSSSGDSSPHPSQDAGLLPGAPLQVSSGKPWHDSSGGEQASQTGDIPRDGCQRLAVSPAGASYSGATRRQTWGASIAPATTLSLAVLQGETLSLVGTPTSRPTRGPVTEGGDVARISRSQVGSEEGWTAREVPAGGSKDDAKTPTWATRCSLRRKSGASWRSPPRRRACALQKLLAKTQRRDLAALEGFRRRTLSSESVGSAGSADSVSSVDSVGADAVPGWSHAFLLSASPLAASRASLVPQSLDQGPGRPELGSSVFSVRSPIHRANTVAFGPEQGEARLRLDLNLGRLSGCLRDFPQCILEVILSGRGRRVRRREDEMDASVPASESRGTHGEGRGKDGEGPRREASYGPACRERASPRAGHDSRPETPGARQTEGERPGGRGGGRLSASSASCGPAPPAKLRHPPGLSSSHDTTESRAELSQRVASRGVATSGTGRPRLCLWLGSFSIPRDDKRYRGGEDAWFISSACNAVGVADGVGEWEDLAGINPQSFAQDLMKGSLRHVRRIKKTHWAEQRRAEERPAERHASEQGHDRKGSDEATKPDFDAAQAATEALSKAYREAKNYGSSTALVGVLDEDKAILGFANLGDSSGMVLRRLRNHTRAGGTALSVVKRVKGMQHSFNVPYQFAHIPAPEDWERLRATGLHRLVSIAEKEFHQRAEERTPAGGKRGEAGEHSEPDSPIGDSPSCIESTTVRVEAGDLILLGTDGLFDNLFDYEITALSTYWRSLDSSAQAPFAKEARKQTALEGRAGQRGSLFSSFTSGGKEDDITVAAAWVVAEADANLDSEYELALDRGEENIAEAESGGMPSLWQ
ncbi:protein phosphatase 2C-like domain-containing protein, related [Neospora caninum Liverpool]|uniref:Protein phosphatase 2C-like domain-containing protein, related n=1 Tax=Neospora caninum (strain Liverpool) TaxID=572307 RepID=F0V7E2_NEOCL|nr:protein phosphatase 2C-like domain-containing protein, related [Neospora caninum Liverpool]CBZ49633.1 protein phosphatase 2C-like domain-containing protein, related [Neospora caninum Liverpool]|eukprot:XP_003879668.1 protein phosphatase 2C-like domain-containing protein, related [Neospora caninum Liverpool]